MRTPTTSYPKALVARLWLAGSVADYLRKSYHGCVKGNAKVFAARSNANSECLPSDGKPARNYLKSLIGLEPQNRAMWCDLESLQRDIVHNIVSTRTFDLTTIRLIDEFLGWTMVEASCLFKNRCAGARR